MNRIRLTYILRGSDWYGSATLCRSADRRWLDPAFGSLNGFRLIIVRKKDE